MIIADVMRTRRYFSVAVVAALLFAAVYIYAHLLGIVGNIDVWIMSMPLLNRLFFVAFSALFGITISFQIYTWRQPKVCVTKKSVGASGAATFIGMFVAQCPACASLGALLLPAGAAAFVVHNGIWLNAIAAALLLFTIFHLGGLRSNKSNHKR